MSAEDNEKRVKKFKKHKMKKWKKILLTLILMLLIIIGGIFAYAWYNTKKATDKAYKPSGAKVERNADKILKNNKPVSILILGTDTGFGGRTYKGRTDSIMALTLNPQNNTTTMVSIPRDMKVNLPDFPQYSPSKINAAYTYGGVKESINALQNHFKFPIDYYVTISLGGLKKAIDQVGGVDVISPLTFDYSGQHYVKGQPEHMDGNKAMWFANMRYQDPSGDYGRQQRQRIVLNALMHKAISYKTVINPGFLNEMSNNVQTNLTMNDMLQLALHYRDTNQNVEQDYAHGTGQMLDGVSFQDVSGSEQQRISKVLNNSLN